MRQNTRTKCNIEIYWWNVVSGVVDFRINHLLRGICSGYSAVRRVFIDVEDELSVILLLLIFTVPVKNIRKSPIQYEKAEESLYQKSNEEYKSEFGNFYRTYGSNISKPQPQVRMDARHVDIKLEKSSSNSPFNDIVHWLNSEKITKHRKYDSEQDKVDKLEPNNGRERMKMDEDSELEGNNIITEARKQGFA